MHGTLYFLLILFLQQTMNLLETEVMHGLCVPVVNLVDNMVPQLGQAVNSYMLTDLLTR